MTISEIKDLTKYLGEEEVEQIKQEIKSKENILKSGNIEEEELIQVLNTFFAILVIEKTLDSEIEEVENIKEELEEELMEAYQIYDNYMAKYKKEKKNKKKNWLLNFLTLSEDIKNKRESCGSADKTIKSLKSELNQLKQQKSDDNLRDVVDRNHRDSFDNFCDCPRNSRHPHHHSHHRENPFERLERTLERAFDEGPERGSTRESYGRNHHEHSNSQVKSTNANRENAANSRSQVDKSTGFGRSR